MSITPAVAKSDPVHASGAESSSGRVKSGVLRLMHRSVASAKAKYVKHVKWRYSSPILRSIIAVHGLGGNWRSTWTNTQSPHFFWLLAGLSIDLPDYNVWSYDYEFDTAQAIDDVAQHLLSCVAFTAQTQVWRDPPLIFLAHGLGGTVVKSALLRSSSTASYRFVELNTRATCFFGTPHRSSSATSAAKALARLAPVSHPPTSHDATQIGIINDQFVHRAPRQQIICFYETMVTGHALILERNSSTLDFPGSQNIAVQAKHSDLARFRDREDPSYRMVLNTLKSIDVYPQTKPIPSPTPPTATPNIERPINFEGQFHTFARNGTLQNRKGTVSDYKTDLSLLKAAKKDNRLIWLHISVTDSSWAQFCLRSLLFMLLGNDQLEIPIMNSKYWSDNERRSHTIPHSRYMEPGCHITQCSSDREPSMLAPVNPPISSQPPASSPPALSPQSGLGSSTVPNMDNRQEMAFYMPYIHWDTLAAFGQRSRFIKSCHEKSSTPLPGALPPSTQRLYRATKEDINGPKSIHPRRSLDQYFYPNLVDTSSRDNDQVVSKRTKDWQGGPTMVMVDQLWLWLIKVPSVQGEPRAAILTCFPEKEEEAGSRKGVVTDTDLYQAILNELQSDEINTALQASRDIGEYVSGVIIERAMNKMLTYRDSSLNFFSIFRDAIGQVAEETTTHFRKFQDALATTNKELRELSDKRKEAQLVLEVLDIIDELNSLRRLLQTQKDTLLKAAASTRTLEGEKLLEIRLRDLAETSIDDYLNQIKRMNEDAERTRKSLMDLLDLQQKEESLDLARLAKEQAEETEAQSQILMLFTIVTIVFLPLSFFTSYYGMNVVEFTGEAGNTNQKAVWKVTGPISFAIIFVLLFIAGMLYRTAKIKRKASVIRT